MGGAMDLVAGAQRVIVIMTHNSKRGAAKLLKKCNLPLTGVQCVQHILTELGWFDVHDDGNGNKHLVLSEIAPGVTVDEIKEKTDADFTVSDTLKTVSI
jgi:3-oxoacid CoA-transferase subunit B